MKINYLDKDYNLPDFLIVGAAKSGTTSLHYYLKEQKNIFLPEVKESYFFSFYNSKPNFVSPDPLFDVISDINIYGKQFANVQNGLLIGDASPSYLYSYEETIKNIKEIYKENHKELKIIILLRNPIDRAWSQYMHFKKNYNEPLDFNEAIKEEVISKRLKDNWNYFYDYINFGRYTKQVKAYIENFDDVKIFLYDDLKMDSKSVLEETINFLNIDFQDSPNSKGEAKVFNISGTPKKNLYSLFWRLKKIKVFKIIMRNVLPPSIRNKINNFLMSKSLKRTQIGKEDEEYLKKIYDEEFKELYNLLKREEINSWS